MSSIKIRRADISDAGQLAAVYRSAYQENRQLGFPAKAESASENRVAEWIREYQVYIATAADDVVGGVRLEETEPERVKLSRLGVHEEWKDKGIGSQLLEYVENAAQVHGYNIIWLTTPEEHPYLPEFYRQRGYEKQRLYPLDYRDYDEIVMEKEL